MQAGLLPQKCIYAPATIHNNINIMLVKKLHELHNAISTHFRVAFLLKTFRWLHVLPTYLNSRRSVPPTI